MPNVGAGVGAEEVGAGAAADGAAGVPNEKVFVVVGAENVRIDSSLVRF